MAFIAPGTAYRRDDDATHSPMFHQIECFLVDENVTMAHLQGRARRVRRALLRRGHARAPAPELLPVRRAGRRGRRRLPLLQAAPTARAPAAACASAPAGFEILGCGMIHPVVFESCGIDPEKWTGFAFGMGVERVAMVRYGIPDMRLLFENDPRFLAQF